MQNNNKLKINSIIGILGGGQLARMLSLEAASLGYNICIYCSDKNSPAVNVSHSSIIASYTNKIKLKEFAQKVHIITYEFENIPIKTIEYLTKFTIVRPNLKSLQITQDRLLEKKYLNKIGAKTVKYINITSISDLDHAIKNFGFPVILKTRLMGYDGKGQVIIKDNNNIKVAYDLINNNKNNNCILEEFINFDFEISIIIARNYSGDIILYEPSKNNYINNILNLSIIPVNINNNIKSNIYKLSRKIIKDLNYIGVMCIEFFIYNKSKNKLIVNEIAPRVHNSGHWTQDGCLTSQFEQHIRAITNIPFSSTKRHNDIVMKNLIGYNIHKINKYLNQKNAKIYIYGKKNIEDERKMGHINLCYPLNKLSNKT